jgi:hypothetical protein
VQAFEQSLLGGTPVGDLTRFQRKLRERIDADVGMMDGLAGKIPDKPLLFPSASAATRPLTAKEQLFLSALPRAYEDAHDLGKLTTFAQANTDFLRTQDWARRGTAVIHRTGLVEREKAWLDLSVKAAAMVAAPEPLPEEELDEMMVTLGRLSPRTMNAGESLATLVLRDEDMREQVLAELQERLDQPVEPLFPEDTEDELVAHRDELQAALLDATGLVPVLDEIITLGAEREQVDAQLQDKGVHAPDPVQRQQLRKRLNEVDNRLARLRSQWISTPPAQEQAQALIEAQDALLRRRIFDMGPAGALFADRYEGLRRAHDPDDGRSDSVWLLIESQGLLLTELDEARPEPDPLDGLAPLPTPIVGGAANRAAILQAKVKAALAKKAARKKGEGKKGPR